MQTKNSSLMISSIANALKVIETFDNKTYSLSFTEIINRTGLSSSAVQRYLYTFEELGYLQKLPTKRFVLTLKNLFSASNFLSQNITVNTVYPYIVQLRQQFDARIGLSHIYEENKMVYLIPLLNNRQAYQTDYPGFTVPAHSTSSGRMLLSYFSDEKIVDILNQTDLKPHNIYTKTSIYEIMQEIKKCREQGFCITNQEFKTGNINVSMPINKNVGIPDSCIVAIFKTSSHKLDEIINIIVPELKNVIERIRINC